MASIFSKIVGGELPCYEIYRDEEVLAFLDIRPIRLGHTLIVPTREIDNFLNVPSELFLKVMARAQPIGRAISRALPCQRVGMSVLGFEVPHFHVHLVPLEKESDLSFSQARQRSPEEMRETQRSILAHLDI